MAVQEDVAAQVKPPSAPTTLDIVVPAMNRLTLQNKGLENGKLDFDAARKPTVTKMEDLTSLFQSKLTEPDSRMQSRFDELDSKIVCGITNAVDMTTGHLVDTRNVIATYAAVSRRNEEELHQKLFTALAASERALNVSNEALEKVRVEKQHLESSLCRKGAALETSLQQFTLSANTVATLNTQRDLHFSSNDLSSSTDTDCESWPAMFWAEDDWKTYDRRPLSTPPSTPVPMKIKVAYGDVNKVRSGNGNHLTGSLQMMLDKKLHVVDLMKEVNLVYKEAANEVLKYHDEGEYFQLSAIVVPTKMDTSVEMELRSGRGWDIWVNGILTAPEDSSILKDDVVVEMIFEPIGKVDDDTVEDTQEEEVDSLLKSANTGNSQRRKTVHWKVTS